MRPLSHEIVLRAGWAFVSLLPLGAVLAGCQANASPQKPGTKTGTATAPPAQVETVAAELRPWPDVVRVQGSLLADEHAVIGTRVAGRVQQVHVDLGSLVAAGDALATLETEEFDLHVRAAESQLEQVRVKLGLKPTDDEGQLDPTQAPAVVQEAALRNQARANLQRAQSLAPNHIITAEELDQCQAELEVAEARYRSALNAVAETIASIGLRRTELALAKQARRDAEIRAPFAGCVQQRFAAPGNYVQIGQPIATLVRTDPLRFRAGVPERQAARLQEGQTATILVEGLAAPLQGIVSRISPALDVSNRTLTVEIDVPNPGPRLRVGLFAEAAVVVEPEARSLAIPANTLRDFAGVEKVWIVQAGQASERVVTTGRRDGEWVEVLTGLAAGDHVVSQPQDGLAGPVVVRPPQAVAAAAEL
jgi:RND family efflux transporter MFP subunit